LFAIEHIILIWLPSSAAILLFLWFFLKRSPSSWVVLSSKVCLLGAFVLITPLLIVTYMGIAKWWDGRKYPTAPRYVSPIRPEDYQK
jgi:hypothetical protein